MSTEALLIGAVGLSLVLGVLPFVLSKLLLEENQGGSR